MAKNRTITNFAKVKDSDLAEVSQTIVSKMTNNANFQNPTQPIQALQAASKEFSDALVKFIIDANENATAKNNARKELERILSSLASYVNSVSEGNLTKLESSGLPLVKPPVPIGILPAPENLKIEDGGNPGKVYYSITPVKCAKGYLITYSQFPAPEKLEDWKGMVIGTSKGYITGLESVKKYVFKAAACGSESNRRGSYNFTQSVERVIQ